MSNYTTWVEVNIGNLKHNFTEVRNTVGQPVRIMAVVKADAYGHGLVQTARAFVEAGADYLGVTTLEEGMTIRDAGLTIPVLVFSPLLPDQMELAVRADLDQTVFDLSLAEVLSQVCKKTKRTARVHIKVDTGMGRLGILPEECQEFIPTILNFGNIEIAGIYTHFANASAADPSDALAQNERFSKMLESLAVQGIPMGLRHAANSAAILNVTGCRYDMVRPGTILYGQFPARHLEGMLDLKPTWCLKTRIVALRRLSKGTRVGYGGEFVAPRTTLAAIIPIGYADGFTLIPESVARRTYHPIRVVISRLLGYANKVWVTVKGKKAPVIGRVSMQMSMIDVTNVPGVRIGDEVVISARRTAVNSRIPRVYT